MNAITTIMAAQASMQHHIIRQVGGAKSMAFADMEPFDGRLEDFRWIAVRSLPGKEFAARRVLRTMGFAAVVPKRISEVRASRYAKTTRPVAFPIIAGYVLVGVPRNQSALQWHHAHRAGLVRGVVGALIGGEMAPHYIRISPLRLLLDQYGDGSAGYELAPATEPGQYVSVVATADAAVVESPALVLDAEDIGAKFRVTEGAFVGHCVTLEDIEGDSAKVLLPALFGLTSMPATIAINRLERA